MARLTERATAKSRCEVCVQNPANDGIGKGQKRRFLPIDPFYRTVALSWHSMGSSSEACTLREKIVHHRAYTEHQQNNSEQPESIHEPQRVDRGNSSRISPTYFPWKRKQKLECTNLTWFFSILPVPYFYPHDYLRWKRCGPNPITRSVHLHHYRKSQRKLVGGTGSTMLYRKVGDSTKTNTER